MQIKLNEKRQTLKALVMIAGVAVTSAGGLVACGGGDDSSGGGESAITLEGTTVGAAQTTWFSDTYLTTLAGQQEVTSTQSFMALDPPFPGTLASPSYFTVFNFGSATAPQDFLTSTQATDAANAAATTWMNGEVAMQWRASYKQSSVHESAMSTGAFQYTTIVALNPGVDVEAQVLQWEDDTHVPWVMQYPGLHKVVRYEKIPGAQVNSDLLPKYIEFFYFPDQASFDGLGPSQPFQDAEADRMATWTDAQLQIPWVFKGQLMIQK